MIKQYEEVFSNRFWWRCSHWLCYEKCDTEMGDRVTEIHQEGIDGDHTNTVTTAS
jgi:hypothetical protein